MQRCSGKLPVQIFLMGWISTIPSHGNFIIWFATLYVYVDLGVLMMVNVDVHSDW